jgi:regulatory protein
MIKMKIIKDLKQEDNNKYIILDNDEQIVIENDESVENKFNPNTIENNVIYKKAYEISLRYLSYRDRTVLEVKNYLIKKNYDNSVVDGVIQKLIDNEFLDDYEYAKKYISYKSSNNNWGEYKISYELRKKGIAESIIHDMLNSYSDYNYEKLCNLVKSKYIDEYAVDRYKATAKAIAFLQRKGHDYEVSKKIVDYAFSNEENQ